MPSPFLSQPDATERSVPDDAAPAAARTAPRLRRLTGDRLIGVAAVLMLLPVVLLVVLSTGQAERALTELRAGLLSGA